LEQVDDLHDAYQTLGKEFSPFLELYGRMQSEKMDPADYLQALKGVKELSLLQAELQTAREELG
jgi:hypothetical protein